MIAKSRGKMPGDRIDHPKPELMGSLRGRLCSSVSSNSVLFATRMPQSSNISTMA